MYKPEFMQYRHFFLYAIILLPLLALLLQGCTLIGNENKPPLKIGLVAPFGGVRRFAGYDVLFGVKLAVKEWNERGGAAGRPIELVAQDDQDSSSGGRLQAQKMALDPAILGVIGHLDMASASAAEEVYREVGLPFLSLGIAPGRAEGGHPQAFHLAPPEDLVAEGAIGFAKGTLRAARLAIVADSSAEGQLLAQAFRRAAAQEGLAVVAEENLAEEQVDFSGAVSRLNKASPDLVLFSGASVKGASFWKAARQAGIGVTFLGSPQSYSVDFFRLAGPLSQGTYFLGLTPLAKDLSPADPFTANYKAMWGAEPQEYGARAYDAANLLLTAIDRAGGKREAVAQALTEVAQYSGVTGWLGFDEERRAPSSLYLYRIEGEGYSGRLVGERVLTKLP
ncbi:MAG TPA: branched-chain amino acid ABC transporter substrate-binding protein [Dehalococcoidia bacterium]|nr:branched-chain amino acid ABC transporter substrate-binding protein [Dehalococcoidia bacterium]